MTERILMFIIAGMVALLVIQEIRNYLERRSLLAELRHYAHMLCALNKPGALAEVKYTEEPGGTPAEKQVVVPEPDRLQFYEEPMSVRVPGHTRDARYDAAMEISGRMDSDVIGD